MLKQLILVFLKKDSFLKNVALLSSASIIAQAINVISMPIFSRMYSPSDFGTLALFSSVVSLLATVSGFRYYLVIPLARTDRYLHSLIWTSFISQVICVALFTLGIEFFSKFLVGTSYSVLLPYRFLMPIGVLCVGIYSLLTQWAIRAGNFSLIAVTKLTQTFSRTTVILLCGWAGLKPAGLLFGNILGQSFGSTSLLRILMKQAKKITFSWTHIKRAAINYRKMFFYDTPGSLINMSGAYLLPIIMAYFFAPSVVGSFCMSQMMLALPSAIIGASIGQVFIQRASEAKLQGKIADLMLKTMIVLIRIGFFPILTIGLLAPSIFTAVLGPKWVEAANFTQRLAPWVALDFVYNPLSMIFIIMMLQKYALIFTTIYTFFRLLSLYIGRNDPLLAMTLLSFVGSICVIFGVIIPAYLVRIDFKKMFQQTQKALCEILFELSPIILVTLYFKGKIPILLVIPPLLFGTAMYLYCICRIKLNTLTA